MSYASRYRDRASYGTAYASTDFMGFDASLTIEYQITDFGYPATWDDPGEGPEFEIDSIVMQIEGEDGPGPEFDLTGRLLGEFCRSRIVNDAVSETIADF